MARIAVVGSREYPNASAVRSFVRALPEHTVVVSGGARGVDTWAAEIAKARGLPEPLVFPAKWRDDKGNVDKGAGFKRNDLIVENCDGVIAFWDGWSRGTRDTVMKALRAGKPVWVFGPSGGVIAVESVSLA